MSSPAPLTYAPPFLWAAARALIATIFALFGAPEAIAAQHTHTKNERSLLLTWLRAGEALMRHLLLIEAAHYAKPNTRPLLRANRLSGRVRVRRPMSFAADKPEAWRVSFHCFLGDTHARRSAASDLRDAAHACVSPRRFYSAWPLAERAEAMARAFNHPEPYAKRLARRLHATPHRAASLTRHPPNLPHVIDVFIALREHVAAARRRFESG